MGWNMCRGPSKPGQYKQTNKHRNRKQATFIYIYIYTYIYYKKRTLCFAGTFR